MSELSAALRALPIKLTVTHLGLVREDKQLRDNFSVKLELEGRAITTPYFAGIGHRVPAPGVEKVGYDVFSTREGNMRAEQAAERGFSKPGKVEVADVIYCLLSDGRACDDTFENWCSDLGFDPDSRKALDMFLACQKGGDLVRRLLGEHFEALHELEH